MNLSIRRRFLPGAQKRGTWGTQFQRWGPAPPAKQRPFWQARYYDFNVNNEEKRVEKLRYMHRNPVVRGLVEKPEDWSWSSFRHYATGIEGTVEIESFWTGARRDGQLDPRSQIRDLGHPMFVVD
jgi:hypothetical protein